MEHIFHEKQEGRMCAQHCLNSLLQGPYFTPVELCDLAQNVDDLERIRMAESGTESESYRDFLQAPSENVDDSGFFSVEVLSAALLTWNLELVPFNSSDERAIRARKFPSLTSAFVCNYHQHWYAIRKIGHQWFNLNSTFKKPKLYSDTYLDMYLAQILTEGHSIFIVLGNLPQCSADEILKAWPVSEESVSMSMNTVFSVNKISDYDDVDEKNFKLALNMSLKESQGFRSSSYTETRDVDLDEVRKKRMQRFCTQ